MPPTSSPPKKAKAARPKSPGRFARANLLTSLVLVLPLLVFYEIGVISSDRMNGADLVTSALLRLVGTQGFIGVQIGLIVIVLGIAAYLRKHQQLRLAQILPVILESGVYALTMGTFIIFVMVDVLHIDPRLAAGTSPIASASIFQKLLMSVGAGVHEELVFRMLLFGGIFALLTKLKFANRRWIAMLIALGISSVLFSAAHHIGPLGDPLRIGVFTYRAIAGLFFGLIYHYRGFAIAVYSHSLYDIYVMIFAG